MSVPALAEDVIFPCADCDSALDVAGEQLICVNVQCDAAGVDVPVWWAHQRLVAAGGDVAAPGAGWPRPLFDGMPHTYLTPVVAGRAWWRLVDEQRQQHCQQTWACQVCGRTLPDTAWVLVTAHREVLLSTAMHQRCLRLSTARCPNLSGAPATLTSLRVTPHEILADHRPLHEVLAAAVSEPAATGDWVQSWTVPRTHGPAPEKRIPTR